MVKKIIKKCMERAQKISRSKALRIQLCRDSQQAQQDQQDLQRDGAAWLKLNKSDDILMISLALSIFWQPSYGLSFRGSGILYVAIDAVKLSRWNLLEQCLSSNKQRLVDMKVGTCLGPLASEFCKCCVFFDIWQSSNHVALVQNGNIWNLYI